MVIFLIYLIKETETDRKRTYKVPSYLFLQSNACLYLCLIFHNTYSYVFDKTRNLWMMCGNKSSYLLVLTLLSNVSRVTTIHCDGHQYFTKCSAAIFSHALLLSEAIQESITNITVSSLVDLCDFYFA